MYREIDVSSLLPQYPQGERPSSAGRSQLSCVCWLLLLPTTPAAAAIISAVVYATLQK